MADNAAPPTGSRAKNWVFTLNNCTEAEEVALVTAAESCITLYYGHEQWDQGTPHLQGFIILPQRIRFSQMYNLPGLSRAFIQVMLKILFDNEFNEMDWPSIYDGLHEVPRMFAVWACKQVLVLGEAPTNYNQHKFKFKPGQDPKCPSCGVCNETCAHVLHCDMRQVG